MNSNREGTPPLYSGASLRRTPLGPTKLSIIERVSSGEGFIIHYVGCIWDSVSVHYREGVLWRGVSAKVFSTVMNKSLAQLVRYREVLCMWIALFHTEQGDSSNS